MFDILLSQPAFMLTSLVLAVVVAGAMAAGAMLFEQQRSRLDPATRWNDIRERLAIAREELARKEAEIAEAIKKLSERDRDVAEIAVLEERRDAVLLELAALDDAKHQIEQTKQAAADAATELAVRQDKLAAVQKEFETAEKDIMDCKAELERLIEEIDRRKREVESIPEALKRQMEELNVTIAELRASKAALEEDMQSLRNERGRLLAERTEFTELVARKTTLAGELDKIIEEAQKAKAARDAIGVEIGAKAGELALLQQALGGANLELQSAREEVQVLVARKEILKREIGEYEGRQPGEPGQPEDMIADLRKLPTVLMGASFEKREVQEEAAALYEVQQYLEALKLSYDRRTVWGFHTALKINDITQLTVLAGVSGTGKSLLPRRYAEAMGIRFLPIAVEPRWDSPQDLLGFYNYIEKRYRATDLARSLVYMDGHNTSKLVESKFGDQMMLVLLDEMNLARVEYYFSEFLSRLETRPPFLDAREERNRRDSWISIDIRGMEKGSINLFPPHNVLFVGTMNDDESTQSLSDKVLDRSNIMQFTAPREFKMLEQAASISVKGRYRSFDDWRRWVRRPESLQDGEKSKAKGVITELAKIMESCGRPFGHRLNASILAYAANYPSQNRQGDRLEIAMVDQIEFRILPKLRGLRIEDHEDVFKGLQDLVSKELNDRDFAERLRSVAEQQRNAGGLFNWRGYSRDTDGLQA